MSDLPEFPEGIVAKIMNLPYILHPRSGEADNDLPFLHVSDLLKNSKQNRYCIREAVLRHYEAPDRPVGSVPAKMRLLWETGNLIGDHIIIRRLIETAPDYGSKMWGDWECDGCGHKEASLDYRPDECSVCGSERFTYKEVDLRIMSIRLVGHPDLLFRMEDGTIIIYEIKTISRGDIDFGTMSEPLGDHFMQASYYYWMLRKLGYKVSRRIRFLYIDRSLDDLYTEAPYKEFCVNAAPAERIQYGIDICKAQMEAIAKKRLPPRICASANDTRTAKCTRTASCFGRKSEIIKTPTPLD